MFGMCPAAERWPPPPLLVLGQNSESEPKPHEGREAVNREQEVTGAGAAGRRSGRGRRSPFDDHSSPVSSSGLRQVIWNHLEHSDWLLLKVQFSVFSCSLFRFTPETSSVRRTEKISWSQVSSSCFFWSGFNCLSLPDVRKLWQNLQRQKLNSYSY